MRNDNICPESPRLLAFPFKRTGAIWRARVHGPRALLHDLKETYQAWLAAGRPGREVYRVEVDSHLNATLLPGSLRLSPES
jgi:hypothetical protein